MSIQKSAKLLLCEKCGQEKLSRRLFKTVWEVRSTRKLQCVHSDVFGPMPTESIGRSKYLVTFIDDYSRRCQVYFMKTNYEVFEKFEEFK
jgi:hypothetical protein